MLAGIHKFIILSFILSILLALTVYISPTLNDKATSYLASVFFHQSITSIEIHEKFTAALAEKKTPDRKTVKILIVPGHDNTYSGAQFGAVKEADLNLIVGLNLYELLSKEQGVEVLLTRGRDGYNPILSTYLERERDAIAVFKNQKRKIMDELIAEGRVTSYVKVRHNTARPEVSDILYGINKFANDNEYDIVLHIHFNDYPGRKGAGGKYSGFSIYVPESQYSNAVASNDFAKKLRNQFMLISAESDLPDEDAVTEDQELIAIGSYNTVDSVAALIEYGYIYESQFTDPVISDVILGEFAQQTHQGIMHYLDPSRPPSVETFAELDKNIPFRELTIGDVGIDVLALQDTLHDLGYYPHNGNLNTCPLSGRFASCTKRALSNYQRDQGLPPTGFFGERTQNSIKAETGSPSVVSI